MKVLIIEDELQAAKRLEQLVKEIIGDAAEILDQIDTVKRAVAWFQQHPQPDVVLMDIQLADGLSFQIFEQTTVKAPVIFTTAYDAYALQAFKVNSIDYILKPVDKAELTQALRRVEERLTPVLRPDEMLVKMQEAMAMLTRRFKTRFVVKVGEHLRTVEVDDVKFFFSQDKTSFAVTGDARNHILDYTLEELEKMLDPDRFFRINRKYLVGTSAIQDIIHYTNSRLKLVLKGSTDNDIIVARERVQEFKDWLDR